VINAVSVENYQGDHFSGNPGNVRDFGYCQGNVMGCDESQGSVREFHNIWKVGTLILTFAHNVVAIPVFSMTHVNQMFC
jgi:hypothetical protein